MSIWRVIDNSDHNRPPPFFYAQNKSENEFESLCSGKPRNNVEFCWNMSTALLDNSQKSECFGWPDQTAR